MNQDKKSERCKTNYSSDLIPEGEQLVILGCEHDYSKLPDKPYQKGLWGLPEKGESR